jgi:putative acetyltransferase
VIVRPEEPDDRAAITAATEAAFGRTAEARMVDAIRASEGFVPALSLVADECGKILGHVILSYVALDTGQRLLELGPLSVCPERQGQGIGGDLVRTALGIADELNEPLVLVLGFPAYYRRFGFQRASAFGIAPPDGIPDDAWIAVTLSSYSPALRGKVIWPAFSGVT